MTYIEIEYIEAEQKWIAVSVSNEQRIHRCSHEDYNILLDEVSGWARLLQAEVRIIQS